MKKHQEHQENKTQRIKKLNKPVPGNVSRYKGRKAETVNIPISITLTKKTINKLNKKSSKKNPYQKCVPLQRQRGSQHSRINNINKKKKQIKNTIKIIRNNNKNVARNMCPVGKTETVNIPGSITTIKKINEKTCSKKYVPRQKDRDSQHSRINNNNK